MPCTNEEDLDIFCAICIARKRFKTVSSRLLEDKRLGFRFSYQYFWLNFILVCISYNQQTLYILLTSSKNVCWWYLKEPSQCLKY